LGGVVEAQLGGDAEFSFEGSREFTGIHSNVDLIQGSLAYGSVKANVGPDLEVGVSGTKKFTGVKAYADLAELSLANDVINAKLGVHSRIGLCNDKEYKGIKMGATVGEASVGPVKAKLGVACKLIIFPFFIQTILVDTGVINDDHRKGFRVIGTGVEIGEKNVKISVLGTEAECNIM